MEKTNKKKSPLKNIVRSAFRVPPNSIETEKAVLGAMMLSVEAISKVVSIFSSDSIKQIDDRKLKDDPSQIFYEPRHQEIYNSIVELYKENNIAPDLISLTEHLRKMGTLDAVGGTNYISEINLETPTYANAERHAKIILEHYFKRCLIDIAEGILENCYDETTDALEEIDKAEANIFAVAEKRITNTYKSMKILTAETMALVTKISSNNKTADGVTTGFKDLDNLLNGGFQKSDLIILAARPSMGKTAFALALAMNAANQKISNVPVGFFSLEMSAIQITMRMLSTREGINAQKMIRFKQKDDEHKITSGLGYLAILPIYFDDSPAISIMELRAKCRRMKAEQNVGLIIVDYLQLIRSIKSESREREISIISSTLKQIARELDIPVLALSQLNRAMEARIHSGKEINPEKTPILSDLRESGSIEQDADIVMFIHRPEALLKNETNKEDIITERN
jgi:replicative DNA helicase